MNLKIWSASLPLILTSSGPEIDDGVRPWNGRRLTSSELLAVLDAAQAAWDDGAAPGMIAQTALEWLSDHAR